MSDNIRNITMDQGSTYSYTWTLTDKNNAVFDLTGYDARLQVRANYGSTSTLINATLPNGKLSIDTVAGTVTLRLTPTDTSSIRFPAINDDTFDCVYDLEIISFAGEVAKPSKGTFTISREITR